MMLSTKENWIVAGKDWSYLTRELERKSNIYKGVKHVNKISDLVFKETIK